MAEKRTPRNNVQMKMEGDILTIKVNMSENFGRSKSGKSIIIASTEGTSRSPARMPRWG